VRPSSTPPRPAGADALGATYDLIVVGAGINGAGVARDAAERGLRVLLLEKEDLSSGTTSWSGRLIHGGLRYLEHPDIPLVRESLRERERLFRLAPHLVRPVPLLMPFFDGNRRPPWMIRLGMLAYDALSWDKSPPRHSILSRSETLRRFSGIQTEGLGGAAMFYDGQASHVERLCTELAVAAHAAGADVLTRAQADELLTASGRILGVRFTDLVEGTSHEARAPVVVNAAGPWIDRVLKGHDRPSHRLIGGSKGSHLVVDPFPGAPSDVVYYESQIDGRLILVIPWAGRYLIGTTDIYYEGDPSEVRAEWHEVDYLLRETNRLIPAAGLSPESVLYTYSGVRPLPFVAGTDEGKIPRSHLIHDHQSEMAGLLSLVGGKLTTYRNLAEQTVDKVFRMLGRRPPPCATRHQPFPGARTANLPAFARDYVDRSSLPVRSAERLVRIYGTRAVEVERLALEDPRLAKPVDEASMAVGAEFVFAMEHEFARTLSDVMMRRTLLGLDEGHGIEALSRVADVLSPRLGWDADRWDSEVADYEDYLQRFSVPAPSVGASSSAAS
jgi:glycerol-3-phosphate dehydrogenase